MLSGGPQVPVRVFPDAAPGAVFGRPSGGAFFISNAAEVVDMSALLSMRNIRKSFFGIPANDDISLDVGEGEIHALLGENGAGKTTLMNILYGIYSRDSGEILWKGEALNLRSPGEAIRQGIGMVHQHFMLVKTLTVSENITLGLRSQGHPFPDRKRLDSGICAISGRYGLDVDPKARVSSLSVGEQQRVEIMKVLYRKARLLILDEPTAVLTPVETESLFGVLRRLRAEGHSVILITHRIPEVLAVTDRISVLRDGAKIATIDTAEADPESLSRLMIGRKLKPASCEGRSAGGRGSSPVLEISSLDLARRGLGKLSDVSLSIGAGEILGIAGVDGNGQKELAECILGLRSAGPGSISILGARIEKTGVAARKRLGLAYISDDRHGDGLVMEMDLAENCLLSLKAGKGFVRNGFIDGKKCRAAAESAVTAFGIKTPGISVPVRLLSGGNQQKLILARELSGSPSVIVAFQPTRGLDIGAAEFIRERILERRAAGCAVLLISADLEEILALSDRICVIYHGRLSEAVPNDSCIDMTRIGLLMAGHSPAECA